MPVRENSTKGAKASGEPSLRKKGKKMQISIAILARCLLSSHVSWIASMEQRNNSVEVEDGSKDVEVPGKPTHGKPGGKEDDGTDQGSDDDETEDELWYPLFGRK